MKKKYTIFFYACFLLAGLTLALPGTSFSKAKKNGAVEMSLPVRMVLTRISPMLEKNEYKNVVKTLLEFKAKGETEKKSGEKDKNLYDHPQITLILANCYLYLEDYKNAGGYLQEALDNDPDNSGLWLNLAYVKHELKEYDRAAICFVKGYETNASPKPDYLYYAAAAYMMNDKMLDAIKVFERLFTAHPKDIKSEWKENLVHAYLTEDKPLKAIPLMKQLIAVYSGDKKIRWQEILLHQYMELKMDKEALAFVLKLTNDNPLTPRWWKALTHIRLEKNEYDKALASLIVYSFLTPTTVEEKKLLADLNMQAGIPKKAAPLYEACTKEKHDKAVIKRLISTYRQMGEEENALKYVTVLEKEGADSDLMLLKGELFYALKKYNEAHQAYSRAAKLKGKHKGKAWLMAGYAAVRMNDFQAGRNAFNHAAKFKKEKKAAQAALRQLNLN